MIDEQLLDKYRIEGTLVRVIRDANEENDVIGQVVAWSDTELLLRKANRRVVKLSRNYTVIPADAERPSMI